MFWNPDSDSVMETKTQFGIGAGVAAVILLLIIAGILYVVLNDRRKKKTKRHQSPESPPDGDDRFREINGNGIVRSLMLFYYI